MHASVSRLYLNCGIRRSTRGESRGRQKSAFASILHLTPYFQTTGKKNAYRNQVRIICSQKSRVFSSRPTCFLSHRTVRSLREILGVAVSVLSSSFFFLTWSKNYDHIPSSALPRSPVRRSRVFRRYRILHCGLQVSTATPGQPTPRPFRERGLIPFRSSLRHTGKGSRSVRGPAP